MKFGTNIHRGKKNRWKIVQFLINSICFEDELPTYFYPKVGSTIITFAMAICLENTYIKCSSKVN